MYTEAGNLAAGTAILSNNNTHAAIASGQYVYVRGHSTLAEGLYKATAAIAANGTLSTSNLTAVPNGGLNDLKSDVTSLSAQLDTFTAITPSVYSSRVNVVLSNCYKIGRWVVIYLQLHSNQEFNQRTALTGFPLPAAKFGIPININGAYAEIRTNAGDGMVISGVPNNTDFIVMGVYNTLQD